MKHKMTLQRTGTISNVNRTLCVVKYFVISLDVICSLYDIYY